MVALEEIAKALYRQYCRGRCWDDDKWEDEPKGVQEQYLSESRQLLATLSSWPGVGVRNVQLYDFQGVLPPWPSYCRMCWRRQGMDPYAQYRCPDDLCCSHYPFQNKYKPKGA